MAGDSDQLAWALKAIRDNERQIRYREARSFYDTGRPTGERAGLGTAKFREIFGNVFDASDNLCRAVVDSVADRLKVTGVDAGINGTPELAGRAWEIWQRNRMDVRAPETHLEALRSGDGYALVWPSSTGAAVIWSLPACDVAVSYDPTQPGVISRAVRTWFDDEDGRKHLDLYFPDRVERYVSKARRRSYQTLGSPSHYEPYMWFNAGDVEIGPIVENPWGTVPIVHFPNRAYHEEGVSELSDVVPLQLLLNKTLIDQAVAQEFAAFPQRYATGFDVGDVDPKTGKPVKPPLDYGSDRMLTSSDPETKFGAFPPADITQYSEVAENHRSEIARVSGTPLHYLFITRGDFPSGEAMKSAEARFTRKVMNRQASFGNQWEDLLALAVRMEGDETAQGPMLSIEWEPASPVELVPAGASAAQPGVPADQSTTPAA